MNKEIGDPIKFTFHDWWWGVRIFYRIVSLRIQLEVICWRRYKWLLVWIVFSSFLWPFFDNVTCHLDKSSERVTRSECPVCLYLFICCLQTVVGAWAFETRSLIPSVVSISRYFSVKYFANSGSRLSHFSAKDSSLLRIPCLSSKVARNKSQTVLQLVNLSIESWQPSSPPCWSHVPSSKHESYFQRRCQMHCEWCQRCQEQPLVVQTREASFNAENKNS